MSQEEGEQESRKRTSARQLTDRDDVDADVQDNDTGTWRKADAATMQTRKIFKVRGGKAHVERNTVDATPAATASTTATPKFTFATQSENKEENQEAAKEGTPVKEAPTEAATAPQTPTKETTTAKEATPTKEAPATSSTPSKDASPQKEATPATQTTPAKDNTNGDTKETKEATPTKTDGSEPPKPLFSFTSPSFPTSFSQAATSSFPTLTSNPFGSSTSSAFSSSTTGSGFSGFTGFNFPSVNFSAGGSSVFGAGGAKKEGSDDEGDGEGANPEEEVPITGPSKLPIIPTVTGEEDETTIFSIRAKLYAMAEGKWQERGVGQLKLNKAQDGKCRLLMRDQGGKHLRLNAALFPEMKVDKTGDKSVQFVAIGTGGSDAPAGGAPPKPFTTFAARVGRKEEADEIFDAIQKHKKEGPAASSTPTTSPAPAAASSTATTTTTPETAST
eukprot:Phypoly_transcript_07497.p1 GENE.Phypoly_transcript_07497~~Phypoly_transcript_07497.p1  ORF type:complete len:467 (+),score=152.01 Phypoly_transcript_07497:61-1401(+)